MLYLGSVDRIFPGAQQRYHLRRRECWHRRYNNCGEAFTGTEEYFFYSDAYIGQVVSKIVTNISCTKSARRSRVRGFKSLFPHRADIITGHQSFRVEAIVFDCYLNATGLARHPGTSPSRHVQIDYIWSRQRGLGRHDYANTGKLLCLRSVAS